MQSFVSVTRGCIGAEHVKKEDQGGNHLIQIYLQSGPLKRCIPEPLPKYLLVSVATENFFVEFYIKKL